MSTLGKTVSVKGELRSQEDLTVEGRIDREVRDRLASLGHVIRVLPDFTPAAAGMCAIRRLEPGTLEGGADPRRESYVIGG